MLVMKQKRNKIFVDEEGKAKKQKREKQKEEGDVTDTRSLVGCMLGG